VAGARLSEIEISTDPERIDIDVVHRFLTSSYWARGRSRDMVERSIRNSLCFGAFLDGKQIAFARMITDRTTFAFLADVFVTPEFQGRGVGKRLLSQILAHPDVHDLRLTMLRTKDAQELYKQFGFSEVENPERIMELRGSSFAQ
jgi:N-acetylglutamate synthase-like GNAT family acetyltransferase